MKIRITRIVPIGKEHGIEVGNEYEARFEMEEARGYSGYWIEGATGERVKILPRECEVVKEEANDDVLE